MFRFALVLAAGAAVQFAPVSQPASAADLGGGYKDTPYVVVPWQGLYFGAHAGGASSSASAHDSFDYVGDPNINSSGSSNGLIGGGQLGYNIQQGHIVFGVEGDIGSLDISASSRGAHVQTSGTCSDGYSTYAAAGGTGACNVSGKYSTSGGLYGDLTGRLGYATDRVLFYGKGGVAFLNTDTKANYTGGSVWNNVNSTFNFDHSDTLVGWTIGAGAEYAVSPSWSIKAEYQHFDFGNMSYSYGGCYNWNIGGSCPANGGHGTSGTANLSNGKNEVSVTADTVKVGVNYHLHD
jgi:outer membrane immunogenic protein